jgi:hypothetical protein
VLTRYGEGPHISSLALLPFALAFAWLALRHAPAGGFLAAAAICSALVALTNFYGATALAIFYPILVWSLWVTHRDNRMWLRAAAIPALAYGLSAFWLTPSYLRITIGTAVRIVPGQRLVGGAAGPGRRRFLAVSLRGASGKPDRAYAVFLSGGLLFMGLECIGPLLFQFPGHRRAAPPDRGTRLGANSGRRRVAAAIVELAPRRAFAVWDGARAGAVVVLCALWGARHYVRHAWELYPPEPDYRQRVEYRMSDWIATIFRKRAP